MFRSVRFYSVSSPWPDSEQTLSEKLAAAAFKPCGSYTERSSGFEPPTGTDGSLFRLRRGASGRTIWFSGHLDDPACLPLR